MERRVDDIVKGSTAKSRAVAARPPFGAEPTGQGPALTPMTRSCEGIQESSLEAPDTAVEQRRTDRLRALESRSMIKGLAVHRLSGSHAASI